MNRTISTGAGEGKVWLVGAGPGDPDLLTVKAVNAIKQADLILFDNLVSQEIIELFPRATPAFYVGKKKNKHSINQKDLNALLVKKAKQGKKVVRLKGGDPFVFGRGGEELLALLKANVSAEVIPGITSASGCTTAAGIPLTHRGLAQGCTFVTAHAEKSLDLNWQALANLGHTLVFYMGVSGAEMISSQLTKFGMSPQTPLAIIENGCRKNQREIKGELQDLSELVNRHKVKSPSLIVLGDVVKLAALLKTNFIESHWQTETAAETFEQSCA